MQHSTHDSNPIANSLPAPAWRRREILQAMLAGAAGAAFSPWSSAAQPKVDAVGPHFAAQAKQIIVLYMSGGFSHVDSFDPKPKLSKDHDQSIGMEARAMDAGQPKVERFLKAPLWKFRPNRHSGVEVSDLFPHIRDVIHQAAVIRSMNSDHRDHGEATLQLHTGSTTVAMPSLGAWLSYGLPTLNANLPSHVVIAEFLPYNGPQVWDANFLPAVHRGVRILPGDEPLAHLEPRQPKALQNLEIDLLQELNQGHLSQRDIDAQWAARSASFATAKKLQDHAPEALDLSGESAETFKQYGAKPDDRRGYAAQCIMARRLIERGVRFVEVIDSVGACRDNWDAAHRDVASHKKYAERVDQPAAALLQDLKQRGLLDQTLVVFCTEFGRTPWAQDGRGTKGRSHHPAAFSSWLAGAGVKPGVVHGVTDDIGDRVVDGMVHVHDFHATILHLLGLDHTRLTYRFSGRDFRLTDVHGHVVREILS